MTLDVGPYNYASLGTSLRDLGSGGLTLLDPNTFFAKNAKRLAVAGGQNGLRKLSSLILQED